MTAVFLNRTLREFEVSAGGQGKQASSGSGAEIHAVHTAGTVKNAGIHYDEHGHQSTFGVAEVRVERSLGSTNRPRLIVNNVRVPKGAMYVDGVLRTLACDSNREIEVG